MLQRVTSLEDKYTRASGMVYLTGLQALVRLLLVQRRRDLADGRNTAGLVTGYRGSPLGGLDQQLWRARTHLEEHHVRFQAAVNEDLAATALWGSQQVGLFPGATYDGVFGMWYGKGPGVDRSGDVLRHANAAGTANWGGVLAIAGDDHAARSSTLPHQSEHVFVASMMPVLHPAGLQDLLDFGVIGWAMSRYSGCWVALKTTSELMDSSGTVDADVQRVRIVQPVGYTMPLGGLGIRWPDRPLEQELRLQRHKVQAALAFAAANNVDRLVFDSPRARFGIITTGKSYLDVRQALDDLGIDARVASDIGLRLYKVGMPWPLEAVGVKAFARGLEEVLVVEEKRSIIESQLESQLYNWDPVTRPRVIGKFDEDRQWLLPPAGELTAGLIARVIGARIARFHSSERMTARLAALGRPQAPLATATSALERQPYFCSGCPHNTSTRVPDGSRAMAGIGCHYMAQWMDRSTETFTQMGGEGVSWIGQAPFTATPHVFQNLGDGTYFHSGLLAIRAAVAAGVNITYKLLDNDAVAMTGGQPVDGRLTVASIARQLDAEGIGRIAIVSDDPDAVGERHLFPAGVTFHHRDELEAVQLQLREIKGVTVLIYAQMCATEKRRRRKRGKLPAVAERAFINELVCEGCGDCGLASNCLSVAPLETDFGRKRTINQDSCNSDLSCVNGFCPSFVTVSGGELRVPPVRQPDVAGLPAPQLPVLRQAHGIVIAGVGGTGVVTLSAVLGMAAHLDGRYAVTMDQTGLAQKFGAVMSHVRIGRSEDIVHTPRIPAAEADLLIGGDLLVATGAEAMSRLAFGRSLALVNVDADLPSSFIHDRDVQVPVATLEGVLEDALAPGALTVLPAARLTQALVGDSIATNFLLLGAAWQKGAVPLAEEAVLEAIRLNGVAVERNTAAFRWGRLAASNPAAVAAAAGLESTRRESGGFKAMVARRAGFLEAYQDEALAHRYESLVQLTEATERRVTGAAGGPLAVAVAEEYFRVLAYKDEYEVARLLSSHDFLQKIREAMSGDFRLNFHLAPPGLARHDPVAGRPRKRRIGAWILPLFRVLRRLRFLRGTPFDPFGYTADRRLERELIGEYESVVEEIVAALAAGNHGDAVALAGFTRDIKGYGPVKAEAATAARLTRARLLARFRRQPAAATS
ncbi:MAG: indolepyruvate ferredoxin oxidoreductase family protein [Gammaproteobacteria bacterium]|nr:indolepyruvate ferredoxin oxidoreductase family protein [Gammaproteobacteria bacterium]